MKNLHFPKSGILQKGKLHPIIADKEVFELLPVSNRQRLYKRINEFMNPMKSTKSLYKYFSEFTIPKGQFDYIHVVMYECLREEVANYLHELEVGRKTIEEALAEFQMIIPKYKLIIQQDEESRETEDSGTNQEEVQN